jgi:hypothetical protein
MMLARYAPLSIILSAKTADEIPGTSIETPMANAAPICANCFSNISDLHDYTSEVASVAEKAFPRRSLCHGFGN